MSKPFFIPTAKSKPARTGAAIDVAARYMVYRLFEATNRQPGAWQVLSEIGEAQATVERAVERGWVVIRRDAGARFKDGSGSLTDEGRRVARKGLR